jgi:hypothetical protein
MKLDQAQELYTEYRDGTLSPAMKLALEQFFERDPEAFADYKEFSAMLDAFTRAEMPELEAPKDLRAGVLLRLAEQQEAQKQSGFGGFISSWQNWLGSSGQRKLAGAGIAAVALAGIGLGVLHNRGGVAVQSGNMGELSVGSTLVPSTILGVTSKVGDDGDLYHLFGIHLPAGTPDAIITAEVLTDPSQVTDETARADAAKPALKQSVDITNDEELQIPIAVPPTYGVGSTLDLMVQWQPDDGSPPGSQVVFATLDTSGNGPSTPVAPTVNQGFYQTLEYIAANYNVTVIADTDADPDTTITPWQPTTNVSNVLQQVATDAGYKLRLIGAQTYQVYR